ncbi:MAG TPA: serine/threonine-protein kinase, partial [Kofleriaceae bacterium]
MVGATVGRYKLVEKIGAGGMGDVFRAIDPATRAVVAIKLLNAIAGADAQRFITEARAVNRVPHDGVVKVIEVAYVDGGRPYLVMELLEGKSLEAAIVRDERPPLAVVDQILSIVAAAHSVGIVHRDLKPGNIWLSRDGRVRVLDFGVAKLLDENTGVTRTGAMVGTPAYMSPEQVQGTRVDARADLYAIGVMAFELATGKRPYDGPSAFAIAQKHVQAPIPRLRDGSHPAAQPFIDRALAKRPQDRFASADEMRRGLAAWLGRTSSPSLSVALVKRSMFTSRAWFAVGAATLVSGGLIIAAIVSKPATRPRQTPEVTSQKTPTPVAPRDASVPTVDALNPEDDARLHATKVKALWSEAMKKPMLGAATPERTTYRESIPYLVDSYSNRLDRDFTRLDSDLESLELQFATWGTAIEPFAPGAKFDLSPAIDRYMGGDDNAVLERILGLQYYALALGVMPMTGEITAKRIAHRQEITDKIQALSNATYEWKRIDADITALKADVDTWNTDKEYGAQPTYEDVRKRWTAELLPALRDARQRPLLGDATARRKKYRADMIEHVNTLLRDGQMTSAAEGNTEIEMLLRELRT